MYFSSMEHLILIHGALGSAIQLNPLKQLLEKDFQIHVLEFEGHGKTSGNKAEFSTSKFISELEEIIDHVGQSVHVFGYSMGGFIALPTASKENSKIKSITTLGTKMSWSPEIAEREVKQLNPDIIMEKVPVFAKALESQHGKHWKAMMHRTAAYMNVLGKENPITKEQMSQLNIPVQICLGDQDRMVSIEETQAVHEWIPNSHFKKLKDSKHPLEQTDLTVLSDAIRSFIDLLG